MKLISSIVNWVGAKNKILSRKGLYKFLESQLKHVNEGDMILSVGSGGEVGDRIKKVAKLRSATLHEADIDPARKPDLVVDICEWNSQDTYDHIFLLEVLEHTHSPHIAIENLYVSLKPEGRLSLSVPFVFPIHDAPYDFFRFTRFGLARLLAKFPNVQIEQRNSWAQAMVVLLGRTAHSDGSRLYLLSPIFVLMALLLYPLATLVGRLLPANFLTTGYVVSALK